jgi:YVTN family beta-propeller protein
MRAVYTLRDVTFAAFLATLFFMTSAAWAQTPPTVSWPPSPAVKLALNPLTNKVYVVNENTDSVTVMDASTNTTKTIAVGPRPYYIAVNPATNRIYVNNSGNASLTVIDGNTDTNITPAPIAINSTGPIQVNPLTNTIYVVRLTGPGTDEIALINGATHEWYAIATESFQPIAMALNPVTNTMYIAHYATGDARIISADFNSSDFHPVTSSIGMWSRPFAIAANPATNKVYVLTEDTRGPIAIIDGATKTATFPLPTAGHGVGPKALAVNTVTNKIYAAFDNEVIVIDGATNAYTYVPIGTTGGTPIEVGINHTTNKIYVAKGNGALTVIDGGTNATTEMSIPAGAISVGVNPITNKVFVFGETTTVLNGVPGSFALPLTTSITPVAGTTPSFSLGAGGTSVLPQRRSYYQVDSTAGAWIAANGTVSLTGLATGSHTLYALTVDGQDAPLHTSSASAPLVGAIASHAFTVGSTKVASAVSLGTSVNPSAVGQGVTFTASVSGSAGAPSGTVEFRNGASIIAGCSAVALAGGSAKCTTSTLAAGTHAITASYSGNAAYNAATSGTITQTVTAAKVSATIALASSLNPSLMGQDVTLTASVSGANGTPTGSVTFLRGTIAIGGCSAVAVASGKATCKTAELTLGTHAITAQYTGDTAYNAGTSAALDQVVKADSAPPTNVAVITYPANGATLAGKKEVFYWSDVKGATYWLWVGTSQGARNITTTRESRLNFALVKDLPADGRKLYVRLFTKVGNATQFSDVTYTADSKKASDLKSPSPGRKLPGATATFQWTDAKASGYSIAVGSRLGQKDLGFASATGRNTSVTLRNLPTTGAWIFVRHSWTVNGTPSFRDYLYKLAGGRDSDEDDDRERGDWDRDDDDKDD